MRRDDRVDAYIESRAEFARPILNHIREIIHSACPQMEEAIKWSMPAFMYKGQILATMAAFKAHAAFGFWQADLARPSGDEAAMGQFGRIRSLTDLPSDETLRKLIGKAMALTDSGTRSRSRKNIREPIPMQDDFQAALDERPEAARHFASFSQSAQRDYLEWIVEAKRPETRLKRITEAIEWISEGKKRNWKYEKC